MTPQPTDHLSIGQLARRTGVGPKAIRFYERAGLLPTPQRDPNGYRRYTAEDVNRLALLRRLRVLRVPLDATRPLLAGASDARCVDVRRDLLALVDQRLVDLDQELVALHRLRADARQYRDALARQCVSPEMSFRACGDIACLTAPPGVNRSLEALMTTIPIPLSRDTRCADDCCPEGCCDGEECCPAGQACC